VTQHAHTTLVRDTVAAGTKQLLREVKDTFDGLAAVQEYLGKVEEDLIAHAEELRGEAGARPEMPFLPPPGAFLDRYRVNVLVDRADVRGAPVIFERNPTHGNLLGRFEHRAHFGTLVTDFMLIKSGALHRANGGYLILEAKDVLANFMAWDSLKKALKSRALRIETPLAELQMVSTVSLAPEPIPLSVKVILIGRPTLYYLLYALDEDFGELFKVKVDFDDSFPRTPESVLQPVGVINEKIEGFFDVCRRHGLSGSQGVLIPEANVRHLMLREDVAAAVHDERFHIYAARSVDEGLAVLSGREAGELRPDGRYPDGSFNEAVRQALVRNVEQLKALRAAPDPARTV
jgi:predicted ATP-dependent protease